MKGIINVSGLSSGTKNTAISDVPSQSGTLTYTGGVQYPSWENYSSTLFIVSGDTAGVDAGTYKAVFIPATGYCWEDGTEGGKTVEWTIEKAAAELTVNSEGELSLTGAGKAGTVGEGISYTYTGDGAIHAESSDEGVATAKASDGILTITLTGTGLTTITIWADAGSNYEATEAVTIEVACTLYSFTIDDNSWAVINEAAIEGVASDFWAVGDRKAVPIDGTFGNLTISGTYYPYILGFNHNSAREGENTIHWQFAFDAETEGNHIAFTDSDYGNTGTTAGMRMNLSNTNVGGWASSYMRSDVCTAFEEALPEELVDVIVPITKYTDNAGNSSNSNSNVTATTDEIFLASEYEIQGSRSYANTYEQNYQEQYRYYKNGNSKVTCRHDLPTTACIVWTRSAYYSNSSSFCIVYSDGSANIYNAYRSYGFAPCFAVGKAA